MNYIVQNYKPPRMKMPRHGSERSRYSINALTVTEVRTTSGFAALATEWRELLADSDADCLFLTWEWLYTWWNSLAGSRHLRILVVRRGSLLIGIAPFAIRAAEPNRLLPFRAVEFIGVGAAGSDYLDLILRRGEEEEACAVIAEHLGRGNLMLDMRRIAKGHANAERLVSALLERGWSSTLMDDDICPYVSISGLSWDQYYAGLSRKFRYSLRRSRKIAQSAYSVSYVSVCQESGRSAALRTFVNLHDKRWGGRRGSQALPDDSILHFHEQWSRIALARGWLRLSILSFDETPAASNYGFSYGGRLYFYLTAFDPAFATYAAGRLCLEEGIREAFCEGLHEYDFLHGDERYKFDWTKNYRALGRYRLFPPGMRGATSRWIMGGRERAKLVLHPGFRAATRCRVETIGGDSRGEHLQ